MADLPISGLPAITVPSSSYLLAAVSESVTAQMNLTQVAAAISSSFTASQAISSSYTLTASYASSSDTASYAISSSYALSASYSDTAVTASYAISSSYAVTASYASNSETASYAISSSYALNAVSDFPYTGSAIISGSLIITGSARITGSLNAAGSVSAITMYAGVNGFTLGNGNNNGISNIAIGRLSLDSNTTGANNLAVGNATLNANNSGNDNVAVGQNAMITNTTGYENTAVGFQSLLSVSTGNNNTAVGANALQVATGQNNTAVGNRAAFYLTSGDNNTIIGKYTGTFGMPAMNNTIIIADGAGNIGYKYSALRAEITGSLGISGSTNLNGAFYIQSSSLFNENTGSSLVSYDTASGQLFHTTYQSVLPALFAAGAFYSTGSTSVTANQSGSFTYTTTLGVNSVDVSNGSRINVDRNATYNFQFSIQIHNKSQAVNIAVWLKKNGANVADTATYIDVPSNQKSFLALNLWDTANAGDYYEIAYQADHDVATLFETQAATGNIPQSPSIIVTVNQVR